METGRLNNYEQDCKDVDEFFGKMIKTIEKKMNVKVDWV